MSDASRGRGRRPDSPIFDGWLAEQRWDSYARQLWDVAPRDQLLPAALEPASTPAKVSMWQGMRDGFLERGRTWPAIQMGSHESTPVAPGHDIGAFLGVLAVDADAFSAVGIPSNEPVLVDWDAARITVEVDGVLRLSPESWSVLAVDWPDDSLAVTHEQPMPALVYEAAARCMVAVGNLTDLVDPDWQAYVDEVDEVIDAISDDETEARLVDAIRDKTDTRLAEILEHEHQRQVETEPDPISCDDEDDCARCRQDAAELADERRAADENEFDHQRLAYDDDEVSDGRP